MRATSETVAPGSSDAATSRSFSSCDHRRRRSTDVITSAREIVIALLLGLPLGPAALASVNQGGPQRRNTWYRIARPQGWLFPGQNPANPMTTRQLTRACHAAAHMAEITKRVTPHTLRHYVASRTMSRAFSSGLVFSANLFSP